MITERCKKCEGLLVDSLYLSNSFYWVKGIRCINCGWVRLGELECLQKQQYRTYIHG